MPEMPLEIAASRKLDSTEIDANWRLMAACRDALPAALARAEQAERAREELRAALNTTLAKRDEARAQRDDMERRLRAAEQDRDVAESRKSEAFQTLRRERDEARVALADGITRETQERIQRAVARAAGVPVEQIDGSGCDSGDPVDLTLADIAAGFRVVDDRLSAVRAAGEALQRGACLGCNADDCDDCHFAPLVAAFRAACEVKP
jgi:hypothetical protein